MLLLIVIFIVITLGEIQAHINIKAKSFFIFLSFLDPIYSFVHG